MGRGDLLGLGRRERGRVLPAAPLRPDLGLGRLLEYVAVLCWILLVAPRSTRTNRRECYKSMRPATAEI